MEPRFLQAHLNNHLLRQSDPEYLDDKVVYSFFLKLFYLSIPTIDIQKLHVYDKSQMRRMFTSLNTNVVYTL